MFGLLLGEEVPNMFKFGREVGTGLGEKVVGAKVDWKGGLEPNPLDPGREVGLGLCEKVAGANEDWNGLLDGAAVGLCCGREANVLEANVDWKGLLVGLAVGLGRGLLGAKVLGLKEVSKGGVVGRLLGSGLLDGLGRGLVGLGV